MRSMAIPQALTLAFVVMASAWAGQAPGRQGLEKATRDYEAAIGGARKALIATFHAAVAEAKKQGDAAAAERLRAELRETLREAGVPRGPADEVRLTPEELDACVGRYLMDGGRLQVVQREGDRLLVSDPWTRQPVPLVPLGDDRFRRADGELVYTFLRDETGKVDECLCRRPAQDGRRLDTEGWHVIRVEVVIDGRSRLLIQGDTVRWHHLDWAVPGRRDGRNEPTTIDGKPWHPAWPDYDGWRNAFAICTSTRYRGLEPALPRGPIEVQTGLVRGRGAARVIDEPCADNDWTLAVELDDWQNGADRYVLEVYWRQAGQAPPEPEAVAIPTDGLQLYLPFQGDAKDGSGHGRHGAVEGATVTRDRFGRPGGAFAFDGDDAIRVPAPPREPNGPLSVSVWASYDELGRWHYGTIVSQDRKDARAWLLVGLFDRITWHQAGVAEIGRAARIRPNVWYHLVTSFDGTHHTVYQDGVLCDRRRAPLPAFNNVPILIGRKDWEEPENVQFLKGKADDVRLYDRALTRQEAAALYHEGGFDRHPLVEAAAGGHLATVRRLVAEKADVNAATKAGLRPLYAAAEAGHNSVVEFLLTKGARPDEPSLDGETAAHAAARGGHLDGLVALVGANADATARSGHARTPLHTAAACGHLECARLLLAAGADPNAADARGNTPLHRAAAYGHSAIADLLVKAGARLAARNRQRRTPRDVAREYHHPAMADHLDEAARKGRGAAEF